MEKKPEEKKAFWWCRIVVNRPKLTFGLTLGCHVLFVIITVVLLVIGFNIFPLVLDGLPLQLVDDPAFLNREAWRHRDVDLLEELLEGDYYGDYYDYYEYEEDDEESTRKKRSIIRPMMPSDKFKSNPMIDPAIDDNLKNLFTLQLNVNSIEESGRLADGYIPEFKCEGHCDRNKCSNFKEEVCTFEMNEMITHNGKSRRKRADDIETDEVHERERRLTGLTLIYEQPGGNVFTKENLMKIAKFEFMLYKMESYQEDFCHLRKIFGFWVCAPFLSVLRFFDGTYQGIHDDLYDPSFTNITGLLHLANTHEDTKDSFRFFLGSKSEVNFTKNVASSEITRSQMSFGYPMKRINNDTEDYDSHYRVWRSWAYKSVFPLLTDRFENGVGNSSPLKFFFENSGLYWREAFDTILEDWKFLIGSFAFIFVFMWIQTGSLWITGFGILSIITSFVGANLIYNVVLNFKFFGIFNVLALFIVLGVGADDIFIFTDAWKYTARQSYPSVEHRLSACYKRASVAMCVTSLTTMVAFLVSAFSPLLAISSFGAFAATTIFVNYCSVIVFFPTVIVVHHLYFEKNNCLCCHIGKREQLLEDQQVEVGIDNNADIAIGVEKPSELKHCSSKQELTPTDTLHKKQKKRKSLHFFIVDFFGGIFFKFVSHKVVRFVIIAVFSLVTIGGIYFTTTIVIDDSDLRLFKHHTNNEQAKDRMNFAFKPTLSTRYIDITVVFGLKKQDRTMCPRNEYDPLAPCKGVSVWGNLDLTDTESQMALLELCQDIRNMKGDTQKRLRLNEDPILKTNNMTCFMEGMHDFFKEEGTKPQYPADTDLSLPITLEKMYTIMQHNPTVYKNVSKDVISRPFEMALDFWLTGGQHLYTNDSLWGDYEKYMGFDRLPDEIEEDNLGTRPKKVPIHQYTMRYAAFEVFTDAPARNLPLQDGLDMNKYWDEYLEGKMSKMPESLNEGFHTTYIWHWLRVKQTIAIQGVTGAGVGVGLSFVVIFLATQNIILGVVSTLILGAVSVCVIALMPLMGWKLGVLEGLNLCLVVGLAVDYIVHLAEGYRMSKNVNRLDRLQDALEQSTINGKCITGLPSCYY
ncbi:unnamed protein product [Owenia fusiformis]|uniref:Uncharacterized protein n=1 Tax=Owenia fusiformis TaxID=6347 RepID=A0A8J1U0Z4_OWEFU|nr:unnamed protein product [Owenia fusiformis]